MLARQEEAQAEQWEAVRSQLEEDAKKPLYRTVLDRGTRSRCRILFLTVASLAMLVTIGSGISASRGYALIEVQQKADQLEQENERLKIDIARLKSPERIKSIASEQLDMDVPQSTYFSHEK